VIQLVFYKLLSALLLITIPFIQKPILITAIIKTVEIEQFCLNSEGFSSRKQQKSSQQHKQQQQ